MIKIWLDDERNPPDETWTVARTAGEALDLIAMNCGMVEEISLDHDLGDQEFGMDGIEVLKVLEQVVGTGEMRPIILPYKFSIHSANPVGRKNMNAAIHSLERLRNQ